MDDRTTLRRRGGYTILELMVASTLLVIVVAAVGTAFGAGGEVYGDGVLRAELNATARAVLNRILSELAETTSVSPDFGVSDSSITYNRIETISATSATYGPERRIVRGNDGSVTLSMPTEGVSESLTDICSALSFTLDESRLTVVVTVARLDAKGNRVTQAVTGDVNIDR